MFWKENSIIVEPFENIHQNKFEVEVESDWSSASYFYSLIALSENGEVTLSSFQQKSKQGDAELSQLYKLFGVKTTFENHQIHLKKEQDFVLPKSITLNLVNSPDIAQTIAPAFGHQQCVPGTG